MVFGQPCGEDDSGQQDGQPKAGVAERDENYSELIGRERKHNVLDRNRRASHQCQDGEQQKGQDLVKMVNPRITEKSRDTIIWEESCLSVPEMSIDVRRHKQITVSWQDAHGSRIERVFRDFSAVVVQHELDHLEGVTLLDRSSRLKRSRYLKRQKKLQRG